MRLDQQKLRLREIHVGKAHVQIGLEQALGHGGDLIGDELALLDGFLSHLKNRLGFQHAKVSLVDLQQHVLLRSDDAFLLRLRVQVGALDQFVGASEVGEQLSDQQAVGFAVVNDRVVQAAGGDAAVRHGGRAGQASVGLGIIAGAHFADLLLGRQGQILRGLDLRVIRQGDLFRVGQGEHLWLA